MVGINSDKPIRDLVLRLMEEKGRLENEIRDETAVLEANHVGMNDPLVDNEGYPRTDIDVYRVRHARHRIICLQTDHISVMRKIEKNLAEIHSVYLGSDNAQSTSRGAKGNVGFSNVSPEKKTFAVVGYVHAGSPADLGGLMQNDLVIQFGSINADNFSDITQVHNVVTHSVGQPIQVRVKRNNNVINMNIIPRPGSQPGLLGCQILRPF